MPEWIHSDDVRLTLSFPASPSVTGERAVEVEAAYADTGETLFTLPLSADGFAALMANQAVIGRSTSTVPRRRRVTHPPVKWLEVTLTATTNQYLELPCRGRIQITEYSADGHPIHAIFRRYADDGVMCAPVEVARPQFTYGGRDPNPELTPCPNPAAHEPPCANEPHTDLGDCHGRVREYAVVGTAVAGYSSGERVTLCASHAQLHGRNIRRPQPPSPAQVQP